MIIVGTVMSREDLDPEEHKAYPFKNYVEYNLEQMNKRREKPVKESLCLYIKLDLNAYKADGRC